MSDSTTPPPDPDDAPATLGGVLRAAGASAPRVLTAPAGSDVPVRGTVIHDPGDRLPDSPGGVLLLVGTDPADPRRLALLGQAAARGFTAVVVKRRGQDIPRFVREAEVQGIAVLAADDDLPWRTVDAVLSSALSGSGGPEFTPAPLGGGELYALADHLAAAVGGATVVEDLAQRVIAYSSVPDVRIDAFRERGILRRRVYDLPELPMQRGQYRRVLASPGVVRFPAIGEELPRAAFAVRAGTLPLGSLWVIEPESGMTEEGLAALAETARLAAPHLLRLITLPEAERRLRRDALLSLLTGSGAVTEEASALLGLRRGSEFRLLALAPPRPVAGHPGPTPSAAAAATLLEHAESELVRQCAAHRPDATVAATGGVLFVLLPQAGALHAGRRFAEAVLTAVRRAVSPDVTAALTRAALDVSEPASLRREAEAVLRAVAEAPAGAPVAMAPDVRHRMLLDRVGDELERDPWLRPAEVAAMLAHDALHGTGYGPSLTAWLDEVGDVAAAAGRLQVHPNTLRHRLRRVRELFGLDLDDPDVRLGAWLELRRAAGPRAR
ncbi:PucR family transcriptional regulator [Streptomyces sp. NPDC058525]|uniref:PucR family transcriptional regulator n=1 Tax=Streptomyces sp. NPDC058525 TaxID=3346538 RepID=UPI00364E5A8B